MAGWQYPFLLPFLAIPVGMMVLFCLKNPEPKKPQKLKEYLARTWRNINRRTVWGLFIVNVLLFVILYGAYLSYFPLLLEERLNATSLHIGLFMSGFSFVTATTSSQLRKINRRIKTGNQIYISIVLYMISMTVIAFAREWWQLIIPLITFGIGHGIMIPAIQTQLVGFAPLSERAGFMSINSMVLRLGQTIGPLFIAIFYAVGGTGSAFLGGTLVAFIMLIVSMTLVKLN